MGSQAGFTESMRQAAGTKWTCIVNHKFADELAAGTISPAVMKRYCIQDHRFLDSFVVLLSSMVAHAPSLPDRVPGCQFLALITGKENTFFERVFEAMGVNADERDAIPDEPCTVRFKELMRDAAASGSLVEMLSVLVVCEWSYQSWGERVLPASVAEPWYCQEWIALHSGDYFGSVVRYLRDLLDREAAKVSDAELACAKARFLQAVDIENDFFDMAYNTNP
uniref:Thiaminase-2/PQQC domain-containing protein n=1 Tax=Strombidinopsis acuminata TaxID=141414 RepID=A0A7S3TIR6_9SPIT|eukprot:scaffold177713_cov35-Tisochrysis_lutea.AAC.2